VTLTHGGWEALGGIAPILRRENISGWQGVLGIDYAAFADRHEQSVAMRAARGMSRASD
jgi:hypothetical protein